MKFFTNAKESLRRINSALDIDSRNKKNPVKTKLVFSVLSLLAAVLLWSFVAWDGTAEITRSIDVPVEYTKTAEDIGIFKNTETVSIKVAGNMASLSRLNKSQLTAKVILEGIAPGKYDLPVVVDNPSGVRIVSWKPSLVEVELYKKKEKLFPVSIKPLGEGEDEMEPFAAEILPASALVSGPREQIDLISSLEARVDAKELKEGKSYTAELVAVDENNKPVTRVAVSPKTVVIKPQEAKEGIVYPIKIQLQGQPASGYEIASVRSIPEEIRLKGKSELLENIQQVELPAIDISGLKDNMHTVLSVNSLELGDGVEIVGADKVSVDITVKKGLATKTFTNVPVTVTGYRHGEKWACEPSMVTVVAEGSRVLLDSARAAPCTVCADLTSIVTSKITLPVIVKNVKSGIKILNVEPEEVTLHRE